MARRTAPPAPVADELDLDIAKPRHGTLSEVPLYAVAEVVGFNPRTDYGEEDGTFAALVESIRRYGVLQPILLRDPLHPSGSFVVVAGHRRLAAAKTLRLESIPAIVLPASVVDAGDAQATALALAENLQRRDLNPLEEAEGYQRLESMGWTQENIGRTVGRSQPHVSRALSLLGLPEGTRTMLREGLLSASHGAELVRLLGTSVAAKIDEVAGAAVEFGWSVRGLGHNVTSHMSDADRRQNAAQTTIPVDPDPAPAREYATSHKSPTEAATAPDALTRPADPAPEVKPGYTPADAKAEYEASQQPDPDETTPVQDAIRAAKEREEAQGESGLTYAFGAKAHAKLIEAGYEDEDAPGRVLIDDLAADAVEYAYARNRILEVDDDEQIALRPLAEAMKAARGYTVFGWADYAWWLIDEAIAGRPPLTTRCADLLGKIAEHYSRDPEEQLYAILGLRWQAIEEKLAAAAIDDRADLTCDPQERADARFNATETKRKPKKREPVLPPDLEKGKERWVLWGWIRREGADAYEWDGAVVVGRAPALYDTLAAARFEAETFSRDDWTDWGQDSVIGVSHQLWTGEQYGEKNVGFWHRGEAVEVERNGNRLTIKGQESAK